MSSAGAAIWEGSLQYAAALTRGVGGRWQPELLRILAPLRREEPFVTCSQMAVWVAPELYCRVQYRRRTPNGLLQGAAFSGLLEGAPTAGKHVRATM